MRRKLALLIAAAMLLGMFLTGCGEKDKEDESAPTPQQISPEQRKQWQEQGRDPFSQDVINEDGTRG